MKKLSFKAMVAIATVMMIFTSCLGDGNNETTETVFGVTKSSNGQIILKTNSYYYSPIYFGNYSQEQNECYVVNYTINLDSEANQGAYNKGYYTASVNQAVQIPVTHRVYPSETNSETTTVYNSSEQALKTLSIGGYAEDFIGINLSFEQFYTNQVNEYLLTYEQSMEPVVEEGNRIYDLYLRTLLVEEGKSTTNVGADVQAFNLTNFMTSAKAKEKAEGKNVVNIRFNYVSEIGTDDEGNPTIKKWAKINLFAIVFATE